MIYGKHICLTAVERADIQQLMLWRNQPDFRKHFREYRELNSDMQNKWFEEKVLQDPNTIMFSVRKENNQQLLGCCGLVYINWIHRHADLSLYIGWNNSYIDDKGYADESCRLLLNYAFNELSLNKVWTEIYEFDGKKKQLYNKFKFQQDGLLRQNYYYDGKWWDSLILSILAEDYLKDNR
ncbi:MAG TPA: N-acetyltransferase [bacterium]|nr:N-acetyltransferase [bacterium]